MGKIIVFENISIDGYIADTKGDIGWVTHDVDVMAESAKGQPEIGAFLFGRKTYQMMANYWPSQAALDANPVFANILNQTPKVVFSKSLKSVDWTMTMAEPNINSEIILRIKNSTAKNLMIFGSASIVSALADLNLIDEYHLVVSPIILGSGLPLFANQQLPIKLKLIRSRSFNSGVVLNQYSSSNTTISQ